MSNKYQTNRVKISEKLGKISFLSKKPTGTQNSLKIHQSPLFNPKYYKVFSLGLFSFLCAYLVASTLTPVKSSDAAEVIISNNTSDFFIKITSADSLPISVTSSPTGQLAYATDSLNVATNSQNGYKLYVSTSGNDNNIYQNGDSGTSAQGYFGPTTGTIANPTHLSQNTWGFALSKVASTDSKYNPLAETFAAKTTYVNNTEAPTPDSTWAAVPTYANAEQAKISELSSGSNAPAGTDLDIYYGVNASTTLPTGNYSTTITYTAFSEGVNVFPTMQDFTSAQCDAMGTNTSINLSDSRDDKYYRVTKMADGHCWMTDNLALDGADKVGNVRVLTPNDSNVAQNRTLAENITDGTAPEYDVVQIYSGIANNVTSECDSSYPDCIVNTTTKYGNLYNWNAATAGVGKQATTGTVTESICPKGWRLPDNAGDFSYANLFGKYNLPITNSTNHSAVQVVQQSPLNFSIGGQYSGSSHQNRFTAGYWTRVNYNNTTAMRIDINSASGRFYPFDNGGKGNGFSVRCVFAGQNDEIMQRFTAAQCSNLAESTAQTDNRKTMIDSRDGKFYTISKLADGNCWMTSNLALDGMDGLGAVRTLTTADSNVTESRTLATNITNNTTSVNDTIQIYSGNANDATANCGSYASCVVSGIKYGNLYSWTAATAGVGMLASTGTITESVCPKNWQLPNHTGAESFIGLLSASGLPTVGSYDDNAIVAIQSSPFYFPLAGYYVDYNAAQGEYAYYWSRTVDTNHTNNALGIHFNVVGYGFNPQSTDGKRAGEAVRCVFGS